MHLARLTPPPWMASPSGGLRTLFVDGALPGRPAGHPGDLRGSGPAPATGPTHRLPNGKRIPGLKLDHPRQLALMHALVRFSSVAGQCTFTTAELYARTAAALETPPEHYRLSSLRYELGKLRAKGLVEKLPRSRRYRLLPAGYRICVVFLKLFERIYAPLTAGLLHPFAGDAHLQPHRRSQLDKLYQHVVDAVDCLLRGVGLTAA
jgi:hypothetical protein